MLLARNETIFMDLMEGLYEEPDDIYGLLQWATNGKKSILNIQFEWATEDINSLVLSILVLGRLYTVLQSVLTYL